MVKIFRYEENSTELIANTYIIGKIGGNCLIVDIGSNKDDIISYVDSHYDRVVGVLLTHGHFDHIRGLNKLLKHYKNKYEIPVYLSEYDKEFLTSPQKNSGGLTNENIVVNVNPIPVTDGEKLKIKDFHVQVIHTPFHTMGSVCYLFEDDNALFTGDTLFKDGIGRTDLYGSDASLMKDSLKKLGLLNGNLVVYPGHGPVTRLQNEKQDNPFLK